MYYAIQVFTRSELEVIDIIKKKLDKSIVIDCFTPTKIGKRKTPTGWVDFIERYFPGYIFIESNDPVALHKELYKIPNFTRLLGKDKYSDEVICLTPEECKVLDLLANKESNYTTDVSYISLTEGKDIKVIAGPLMGFAGKITKVNLHKRYVLVNLDMLGQSCEVKLSIDFVKEDNK